MSLILRSKISSSVLLALLSGSLLWANEPDELLILTLEELLNLEVQSATKATVSVRQAPAFTVIISRQDILTRGYDSLIDLVQDLPGFNVQMMSNVTRGNRIAAWGIVDNNKFIILRNGYRITSPTGENIPVSESISLLGAERVEVVYGPSSAVHGSDAFGAVINIVTRGEESRNSINAHFYSKFR